MEPNAPPVMKILQSQVAMYGSLDDVAVKLFDQARAWNVQFTTSASQANESRRTLRDLDRPSDVRDVIQATGEGSLARIFIIRQKTSWSRLQISRSGFDELIAAIGASHIFNDFVRTFGLKVSPSDEDFGGYDRRVDRVGDGDTRLELAFLLRYPAKVARESEYPWVFRQFAVYQSNSTGLGPANWIFIQPPQLVVDHLLTTGDLNPPGSNVSEIALSLRMNLVVLSVAELDWRRYLNYMEGEIAEMNDKACFSKVGAKSKCDFSTTFNDLQELQQSRQHLLRALSAVKLSIETSKGVQSHLLSIGGDQNDLTATEFDVQLYRFQSRMKGHKRAIRRLLEVTSGIENLLSKVLDFRRDENLQRTAASTQTVLDAMGKESADIRMLAEKAQKDSRSTNVQTFVALAYVPANLLAAVFSSSLVVKDDRNNPVPQRLQISYFILISLSLTIATLSFTWALDGSRSVRLRPMLADFLRRTRRALRNLIY